VFKHIGSAGHSAHGPASEISSFANLFQKASDDGQPNGGSREESKEPEKGATAVSQPAVPQVVQQPLLPIAGFITWTGKTAAAETNDGHSEADAAEPKGTAETPQAPQNSQAPRTKATALLGQNIPGVNVFAAASTAETKAPVSARPGTPVVKDDSGEQPSDPAGKDGARKISGLAEAAGPAAHAAPVAPADPAAPAASAAPTASPASVASAAPAASAASTNATAVPVMQAPVTEIRISSVPDATKSSGKGSPAVPSAALEPSRSPRSGFEFSDGTAAASAAAASTGAGMVPASAALAGNGQPTGPKYGGFDLNPADARSSMNGSAEMPLPSAPTAGESRTTVSTRPLAFAARLTAEPATGSEQSQPQQAQPRAASQPTHASAAPAGTEADAVTAAQTAAQSSFSGHSGAEQGGEQPQKAEQRSFTTQAAAWEHANAARPETVSTPAEPAESRVAEVEPQTPATSNNAPVRDVRMQLTGSENQRVDVRVMDRGGELRVSVRADDPALVRSLRDNMDDLSTRLDQAHFRSEVWAPRAEAISRSNSADTNGRTLSNGNEFSGQDGQGKRQNGRQNQQPAWMDDFEESTAGSNSGGKR